MGRWNIETKRRVTALLDCGLNHTQIARRLGITKHTVAYHARTLGRPADPRFTRRYDWPEIQRYYDEGHSVTECQARFGFARETWNAARRRGAVIPRPHAIPIEQCSWSSTRRAGVGTSSGGCWPTASRSRAANAAGSRIGWASRLLSRCITSTATT